MHVSLVERQQLRFVQRENKTAYRVGGALPSNGFRSVFHSASAPNEWCGQWAGLCVPSLSLPSLVTGISLSFFLYVAVVSSLVSRESARNLSSFIHSPFCCCCCVHLLQEQTQLQLQKPAASVLCQRTQQQQQQFTRLDRSRGRSRLSSPLPIIFIAARPQRQQQLPPRMVRPPLCSLNSSDSLFCSLP